MKQTDRKAAFQNLRVQTPPAGNGGLKPADLPAITIPGRAVFGFGNHKRSSSGLGNLKRSSFGFTLAELLIALAILGVIATFTIPKVLQGQQDSRFRSIAKETAASVSAAYQHYRLNNPVTAGTAMADLTPFLNYVQRDTTNAPVDHKRTFSGAPCNNVHCLRLHNGAVLWYDHAGGYATMGGTATTNCVIFLVDPDGKYSGTTNGPGKAVEFALYSDGALRTRGTMRENSYISAGASGGPEPTHDPDWFGWD